MLREISRLGWGHDMHDITSLTLKHIFKKQLVKCGMIWNGAQLRALQVWNGEKIYE
jgi:hypothetical protein